MKDITGCYIGTFLGVNQEYNRVLYVSFSTHNGYITWCYMPQIRDER